MGSGDITKAYDPLERILAELGALRGEVNGLANNVASLETRLTSVETRLSALENKVEKKLMETKPLWVAELNNRIDGLEAKVDGLEAKVDGLRIEIQKGFSAVTDRMDEMAIDISKIRGAQRGVWISG